MTHLGVLLDGDDRPNRQPDGLLVVDVNELGVAPGRFAAALDAANFCKENVQEFVDDGLMMGSKAINSDI